MVTEKSEIINIKVKRILPDDWSRPRLKNIETGKIYVDISLGNSKWQPRKYNIAGDWHTTAKDGEPDMPLKENINFILSP